MNKTITRATYAPKEPEIPRCEAEFMIFKGIIARYGDIYLQNKTHNWLRFQLHVPAIQRSYDALASCNRCRHTAQITVPLPMTDLDHRDKDTLLRLQEPLILSRIDFRDTKLFLQAGSVWMGNGDTETVVTGMIGELRGLISNGDIQANIRE